MTLRADLLGRLWNGADPFAGVHSGEEPLDLQGWHSQHPFLGRAIATAPRVVVEVGVWKGGSVVFMAERLRDLGADSVIIAVDTWLGSWEHWRNPEWRGDLRLADGYPTLYRTFQENVVASGVADYVIPLPLDSVNAAALLYSCGIQADLVHVDAGHDYRAVLTDLETWWERLNPGGILIADDYDPSGESWPRVRDAVDVFVEREQPVEFEAAFPKAMMRKPSPAEPAVVVAGAELALSEEDVLAIAEAGDADDSSHGSGDPMNSAATTLENRLNSMTDVVPGERSLWHDLNARLGYFRSVPPASYSVRPWRDSSLPEPGDPSVVLLRWEGPEHELFVDERFFDPSNAAEGYVLDRAFIVSVALSFAAHFCEGTSGEALMALYDAGRPEMLSFTDGGSGANTIPDTVFILTLAYEVFRAEVSQHWIPWEHRRRVAVWRGGLHGLAAHVPSDDWSWLPRAHLCAVAETTEHAGALDAKLTGISPYFDRRYAEHAQRARRFLGVPIPPLEHMGYRYTFDVDGWANAWSGLFQKLLTGSTVLKVASQFGYRQWYYDRLEPWVNFIPVRADLADLDEALEFVLDNDAEARTIGMAGRHLALSLSLEAEIFAMASVLSRKSRPRADEILGGVPATP